MNRPHIAALLREIASDLGGVPWPAIDDKFVRSAVASVITHAIVRLRQRADEIEGRT